MAKYKNIKEMMESREFKDLAAKAMGNVGLDPSADAESFMKDFRSKMVLALESFTIPFYW